MEKQFIDLVNHVFTLQWAIVGLPLAFVLSLLTRRALPGFILAAIAVVAHHVIAIALAHGGSGLAAEIQAAIPKLEPISIAAEYVAYAFLIIVFSLTRVDMFRPSVTN